MPLCSTRSRSSIGLGGVGPPSSSSHPLKASSSPATFRADYCLRCAPPFIGERIFGWARPQRRHAFWRIPQIQAMDTARWFRRPGGRVRRRCAPTHLPNSWQHATKSLTTIAVVATATAEASVSGFSRASMSVPSCAGNRNPPQAFASPRPHTGVQPAPRLARFHSRPPKHSGCNRPSFIR